jgi:hypothetical protein
MVFSSQAEDGVPELITTIFIVTEEVETGTAGGKQNGITRSSGTASGVNGLEHGTGIKGARDEFVEGLVKLLVIDAQEDEGVRLVGDERRDVGIVVALVSTTENEDEWGGDTINGVAAGIDVGGLGVVDIGDATYSGDGFEPVRYAGEGGESLRKNSVRDTSYASGGSGGEGIIEVMCAGEGESAEREQERGVGAGMDDHQPVVRIGGKPWCSSVGKGVVRRRRVVRGKLCGNDRITAPIDKGGKRGLVAEDTELGVNILLEVVMVTVKMIRGDVGEDGDVGTEVEHVVELETGQFNDVVSVRRFSNLKREAMSDVAGEPTVEAGRGKEMVSKEGGGGFAVTTGDADHVCIGVPGSELNFGNDRDMSGENVLDDGSFVGNTGAFDDFVGVEDVGVGVLPFLEGDAPLGEEFLVFRRDGGEIREEGVKAFGAGKNGGTGAAFSTTQDNNTAAHRILRVIRVMTAKMIPTSQKRITILDSGTMRIGR